MHFPHERLHRRAGGFFSDVDSLISALEPTALIPGFGGGQSSSDSSGGNGGDGGNGRHDGDGNNGDDGGDGTGDKPGMNLLAISFLSIVEAR